jgi:hypothetical protein
MRWSCAVSCVGQSPIRGRGASSSP